MKSNIAKVETPESSDTPYLTDMNPVDPPQSFRELKAQKYGPEGSPESREFRIKSKIFRVGLKLREVRKQQGLSQEELATKIGRKKAHISRIERGADLRLSTLISVVEEGLERDFHILMGEVIS